MRARASPTQMRFPVDTQETEGMQPLPTPWHLNSQLSPWSLTRLTGVPLVLPSYQLPPRGTGQVATSCLFAEILPGLELDRLVPKDPWGLECDWTAEQGLDSTRERLGCVTHSVCVNSIPRAEKIFKTLHFNSPEVFKMPWVSNAIDIKKELRIVFKDIFLIPGTRLTIAIIHAGSRHPLTAI